MKNVTVKCPKTFSAKLIQTLSAEERSSKIQCQKCPVTDQYAVSASKPLHLKDIKNSVDEANPKKRVEIPDEKCFRCPVGAVCDNDIMTRDNFHGFVINKPGQQKEFEFLLCPEGYCCSRESVACNSISTCALHREGRLCGSCKQGYFNSFLGTDCLPNSQCTLERKVEFWILFISTSIALAFILTFSKDMKGFCKSIALRIKLYLMMKFSIEQEETSIQTGGLILISPAEAENEEQISITCIFNILVSFYQLKALISLKNAQQNTGILDKIFNIN